MPPRIHRPATQEAPRAPRSTIIHALALRTLTGLQPALVRAKRVPHTAQVPAQGRQETTNVQRGAAVLQHDCAAPTIFARRCARHTIVDGLASPAAPERRSPHARANAVREEVPPRRGADRGDTEAEARRSKQVDKSQAGGEVWVQPVLCRDGGQGAREGGMGQCGASGGEGEVGEEEERGEGGEGEEEGALGEGFVDD